MAVEQYPFLSEEYGTVDKYIEDEKVLTWYAHCSSALKHYTSRNAEKRAHYEGCVSELISIIDYRGLEV